jgi:hypothetical protein
MKVPTLTVSPRLQAGAQPRLLSVGYKPSFK